MKSGRFTKYEMLINNPAFAVGVTNSPSSSSALTVSDWDLRPNSASDGDVLLYSPTNAVYRWLDAAQDWVRNEAYTFSMSKFDKIIGDESDATVLTDRGWTANITGTGTASSVVLADGKPWFQLAQTVSTGFAYIQASVSAGQGCYMAGNVRISALQSANYASAVYPYFANGTDEYMWHIAYSGIGNGGRWRQNATPVIIVGAVHLGTVSGNLSTPYNGSTGAFNEVLILPNNRGAFAWYHHSATPVASIDSVGALSNTSSFLRMGDATTGGSSTTQMRDMLVCIIT